MEIYSQKSTPFIRWIVAAILLGLFIGLIAIITSGKTLGFDDALLTSFASINDSFMVNFAKTITFFANTLTIIFLCLFLLFLPSRMTFGAPVVLITAVTSFLNFIFKIIIGRERPDVEMQLVSVHGNSFPSGHSITALVFYISLMILLRRYFILRRQTTPAYIITAIAPTLVVLIGFSRVFLGVHYPTDVLGGWLLGSILMIIGVTLYDNSYPSKFILTYHTPAWGYVKKKKPWRKPISSGREVDPIEVPKFRSNWRKPKFSSKVEREREAQNNSSKDEKHPDSN